MFDNVKKIQDAFTFALAGMSCVNAYAPVPIAANNTINDAWDERFRQKALLETAPRDAGQSIANNLMAFEAVCEG